MKARYLPVLAVLRELYTQPRSMARFREDVATLTGGGDDDVLPIGVANPMAREHALAKIEELLALGAEDIGAQATRDAAGRLAHDALARAREIVEVLGDDPPYPVVFAALYGDAAAEQLGYAALGLPARAGFEVALATSRADPVSEIMLGA